MANCRSCSGRGGTLCPSCRGAKHQYQGGQAIPCPGCFGKGVLPCNRCRGTGREPGT